MANTYKIVRYYRDKLKCQRTIETGLTLTEAKEHCNDPETSSSTCTTTKAKRITRRNGSWFDAWTEE